ncbi:uncharacterized protein LOC119271419 [Triticum dicoccoides]|uniref:uncharacterized protein LOC119271419 n=1 Tax=Triticum dicoccoides TaxID=85692 RepID=UPI00188F1808|nr:uncharacterized protein LOC119271419 [Triticum dicoccoides]
MGIAAGARHKARGGPLLAVTGHRLPWIHAASKVPDPDTVAAMEDFYREIYAIDGVHHIDFPEHYPVSCLLGCFEVVGCVQSAGRMCLNHSGMGELRWGTERLCRAGSDQALAAHFLVLI